MWKSISVHLWNAAYLKRLVASRSSHGVTGTVCSLTAARISFEFDSS